MTVKTFNLLNAINCEDYNNERWSIYMFLSPTDTADFFGTSKPVTLESGIWIAVYENSYDTFPFSSIVKPDITANVDATTRILFYNVSD